ncbi:alpha/beta hydrolase [Acidisoma sp. C75]
MSGMSEETGRLRRPDGVDLAWKRLAGRAPTIVFLHGFRSDMASGKASFLAEFAAARGQAMLRLDYSGHGSSGGAFEDGTIGLWTEDARRVIDAVTEGPLILVGSSMGGWIGLNLARRLAERVAAFIGIAAAPDFTETLIWNTMTEAERARLLAEGVVHAPSEYGPPIPITRGLIEDGRRHLLLSAPLPLHCPVRLLQGQQDADVPWRTALAIGERVEGTDLRIILVKDGDHRLSRPQDLALLGQTVAEFLPPEAAGAVAG